MRRNKCFTGVALGFTLAVAGAPVAVQAQSQVVPAGNGRIYVAIADSSLSDALEKVFRAAGNPPHTIAPEAAQAHVSALTFNNAQWDNIVRQLASQNNFQFSRDAAGTYTVAPRVAASTSSTDPFASAPRSTAVRTQVNNQTVPDLNPGATPASGDAAGDEGKEYRLITVRHVYEGGIALLFGKSSVITTEQFVSPASGTSGGGKGGGGRSGGGGFGGVSSFGGGSSGSSGVSSFGGFGH